MADTMNDKKRIYLASPTIHGDEQRYVADAFEDNWVAPLGPNVNHFETEIAAYTGCGHAAALSSGTAAIHLGLKLLGVGQGDVVFVSSLTFSASCNPICYEKATPVFIDSEPDTWNMSPEALEKAFAQYPNPKAVVVVHLYGTPAKMDAIMQICEKHHVPILEDAAESLGAVYKGRQTGTLGRIGVYSFNGNKIITTSGGGMMVSAEEALVKEARVLSTQARDPARHYQHSKIGYNYRMSNIDAGIGRGQLLHLDEHIRRKREIYARYKEAFSDIEAIAMNPLNPEGDANNWLSCMTIKEGSSVTPDRVMDALEEQNIESRPIWKPMHLQPVFAGYDFFRHNDSSVSVSEDIFDRGVCLPSDIKNKDTDMDKIIGIIRRLFH